MGITRSTAGPRALALASAAACLAAAACAHFAPHPLSAEAGAQALAARSLADPGLQRFVAAVDDASAEPWPPARWNVEQLTLAALYFHPDLAVLRAQAEVAAAGIRSAGARPNPTLSIAPEWSANPDAGVSPWLAAVHLDWTIETAGKRGERVARARAAAESARYAVAAELWTLRRGVESAVIELAAARRRLRSLRAEANTTARLVARLDERVEAGAASAADTAPFRFAQLQSTAELAAAESAAGLLQVQLADALGISAQAARAVLVAPPLAPEANPLRDLPHDAALRQALLARSDVLAALADYAAAEAALRLEIAKQYPDLRVGPGYAFDQGQNKWSIGVSLDLPILDQNQGPIAEAEAGRAAAAARFLATQKNASSEVELALARRDGTRDQLARLAAARDERRANLRRVRSALALGAADRSAELEARIEALRAARAAAEADRALRQALADLALATQAPLGGPERALPALPPLGGLERVLPPLPPQAGERASS